MAAMYATFTCRHFAYLFSYLPYLSNLVDTQCSDHKGEEFVPWSAEQGLKGNIQVTKMSSH